MYARDSKVYGMFFSHSIRRVIEDKRESCQSTWNAYWFFSPFVRVRSLLSLPISLSRSLSFSLFLKFLFVNAWISFVITLNSIVYAAFFLPLCSSFIHFACCASLLLLLLMMVWLYFGSIPLLMHTVAYESVVFFRVCVATASFLVRKTPPTNGFYFLIEF